MPVAGYTTSTTTTTTKATTTAQHTTTQAPRTSTSTQTRNKSWSALTLKSLSTPLEFHPESYPWRQILVRSTRKQETTTSEATTTTKPNTTTAAPATAPPAPTFPAVQETTPASNTWSRSSCIGGRRLCSQQRTQRLGSSNNRKTAQHRTQSQRGNTVRNKPVRQNSVSCQRLSGGRRQKCLRQQKQGRNPLRNM